MQEEQTNNKEWPLETYSDDRVSSETRANRSGSRSFWDQVMRCSEASRLIKTENTKTGSQRTEKTNRASGAQSVTEGSKTKYFTVEKEQEGMRVLSS